MRLVRAATVSLLSMVPAIVLAQTPARFAAHRDYPSGHGPASIAVGDINGDQRQDLVSANHLDHTVAVLLGNSDGSFEPARSVYLGADVSPRSVAIADFNLDSLTDLAVVNAAAGTLVILPGNGDGTFQPARTVTVGGSPVCVAAGDFDRNGRPDLAIANTGSGDVGVLLGNGDGTFQPARNVTADGAPAFVAVVDFDRDTRPDLAMANTGSGTVSTLLGNGDGTFQPARTFAAGAGVWSVAPGDVNGDGAPDVVAANNGADTVAVLLGNNDGTLQAARTFAAGRGPTSVVIGDFDGDGRQDVAVGNERDGTSEGSNAISVLRGNGDGSFGTPQIVAIGTITWSIAVGNFNGDGAPDLAAANTYSTTVSVLLGHGDGTFPAPLNLKVGQNPEGLERGDFNGDGRTDLVVANAGSDSISVLLGNGNGTFQSPLSFPAGAVPVFATVGDFNRDTRLDVVVANYGADNYYSATVASTVSVLLGNGDGTFQPPQTFEAGSGPHGIAVADVNRDGILDLAVANLGPYPVRATTAAVLLGLGNGAFAPPLFYDAGHALTGVASGDFNRDGSPDLALSSGDDATVSVLVGNGDGTFQPKVSFGAGESPKSVSVGDFNRDQIPDLVVTDHWSDTVSVFRGLGDGRFATRLVLDVGRNPAWVAVGDLTGDGIQDLAVGNWFSTTVSVLEGTGDGTFHAGLEFGAAAAPEKVVLADFNGDGRPDMAVANYFAASVSILLSTIAAPPAQVATPTFSPAGGTYVGPQTVTLSVATGGATIHYTTDGSAPNASSPTYTAPILIARTTTIRAFAVAGGMTDSDEAAATYTVAAVPPSFSPQGGTYSQTQSVSLATATSGAAIHYTVDGSTPTTGSPVYTAPIAVTRSTTIRAIAAASGLVNSAVSSATYTLQTAAPVFTPPAGSYLTPQFVEISSATPDAAIFYTTDGSTPTASSARYTGPVLVLMTSTLRAIAVAPGWSPSVVGSASYTILLH
jgi:hypothetical protein